MGKTIVVHISACSNFLVSSIAVLASKLGTFFICTVFFVTALAFGADMLGANVTVLRGRLSPPSTEDVKETLLILRDATGKETTLFGDLFAEAQLRDVRLAGRQWELIGSFTSDRRFEIDKLFTIKEGRRHRVTYYCEICHIYTHEPGRCMCCQEETELLEVVE